MSWASVEGTLSRLRGSLRSKWGELINDEAVVIAGKRDALVGRLQARYGLPRHKAERRIDEWIAQL